VTHRQAKRLIGDEVVGVIAPIGRPTHFSVVGNAPPPHPTIAERATDDGNVGAAGDDSDAFGIAVSVRVQHVGAIVVSIDVCRSPISR